MILEELKSKIITALGLSKAEFSYPPTAEMGNLSLACFGLAKEQGVSPAELSRDLLERALNNSELKSCFSRFVSAGPYLNFFIEPRFLAGRVLGEISKQQERYGRNKVGEGKKVMIEYSNGNTHKEYHVGHLRNIAYGDAVSRLLDASGFEAIPVSYINDFGIHVAKAIWFWRSHEDYHNRREPRGYLLGQCYSEASRALAADPTQQAAVARIMKQIEGRSGEDYRVWQETRQWSLDYFGQIYKELKVNFKDTFYESQVIDQGLKIVEHLKDRGILKFSQGAVIADLESEGLGVLPVIRSDGTALYLVGDLALASLKFNKYGLDESIYVVDVRQSLYFKQLFKILELSGDNLPRRQLSYDFVTLPDGMMASRTGNIVTYQDLRGQVFDKALRETSARHQNWSKRRVSKIAQILTIATIKFEMLKVSPDKLITFNINEALRFDGYTACYLEYGYARLSSVLRKAGLSSYFVKADPQLLKEQTEKALLLKLAKYPKAVWSARETYNPSEITKYLFELVQLSNDYYHEVNILKADPAVKSARLALVRSIRQVLRNGFALLGIEALREM